MPGPQREFNLKQVAALLDVHYMTAYRYVRSRQLAARQIGTTWIISAEDLAAFQRHRALRVVAPEVPTTRTWRERIRPALESGDEVEGWRILESALNSGLAPLECYLDILVGAVTDSSDSSRKEPLVAEYLAISTASRLVARLGARLRRPGRSRGTVIFGAPAGEYHSFPIAVVADLVRLHGFTCVELGPNVPPRVFAQSLEGVHRVVAIGIGMTMSTHLPVLLETVAVVREADPSIPIVLGGQATLDDSADFPIAGTFWAPDGRSALELFNELAEQRRPLWAQSAG
ncbi:MAG: helix-turn-helix domain-containing protein [Acidimicrobiaceae bacterium]|nr:helix-turn-helix domain-containing protein [Acidimicrobiaceae bacterium]